MLLLYYKHYLILFKIRKIMEKYLKKKSWIKVLENFEKLKYINQQRDQNYGIHYMSKIITQKT